MREKVKISLETGGRDRLLESLNIEGLAEEDIVLKSARLDPRLLGTVSNGSTGADLEGIRM